MILAVFNADSGAYYSYVISNVAGLIAVITLYLFLLGRNKGLLIIILIYSLKIYIGTWHFLTFIQPGYFQGNTSYDFLYDYRWMYESMSFLADYRHENGYFCLLPDSFLEENKNAYLFMFTSDLFYFGGIYVLNICVYNTMFSLFTAIIIVFIGKHYFNLNVQQSRFLFLLAALYPMSLIPSMVYRDVIGQFIITLGGLLLIYIIKNNRLIILLPFACFLFFMQRKVYAFIPLIAYGLYTFTFWGNSENKPKKKRILTNILLGLSFLILIILSGSSFEDSGVTGSFEHASESGVGRSFTDIRTYLMLPVYTLIGFIGPFPWTQFFTFSQGTIYQPSDYLMSVFMITSLIFLLPLFIKQIRKRLGFDIFTISSVLVIFAGLATTVLHTVYLCVGFHFLLPFLVKSIPQRRFFIVFFVVLMGFIVLNFIWVFFGFSGSGLGGSFKG
jgi:hypothetical protein